MKMTQKLKTKKQNNSNILIYIADIIILGVLIWLDQFCKHLAVLNLCGKNPYILIPEVLQLRYLENRGAAFGMLQNQKWFFVSIGILFLIVIFFFLIRIPTTVKYIALRCCLILIAAGAIGNMIDRVLLEYVIDFIYVIYINFPIFNVADCYVTIATALLVILILFYYKEDDLNFKKARISKIHSSLRNKNEEAKKNS